LITFDNIVKAYEVKSISGIPFRKHLIPNDNSKFNMSVKQTVSSDKVAKEMERIFGTNDLSNVSFEVINSKLRNISRMDSYYLKKGNKSKAVFLPDYMQN